MGLTCRWEIIGGHSSHCTIMFYDIVSVPGTANWAFRSVYNAPLMMLL